MDKIKYYKYYNLAKSTSLVVAVLPLFLYHQLGLDAKDIIRISGYYFLLPLLLEIFLGYFSDYFGNIKIIKLGLLSFIGAYIALLCIPNYIAYYIYLFGISFSSVCFSGAEDSLLLALLEKESDLFIVKADIASFVYYNTIILLLIGGVTYYFLPYFVIILQIVSLIIAYIFLHKIAQNITIYKHAEASLFSAINNSAKELLDLYKISLIVLIAVSSFIVLLNNRTISIYFSNIVTFNPAILLAFIFIVGNLLSAKANLWFKDYFKKYTNPLIPVFIIGLLAIASFLSMSIANILGLTIGFFLIAIFKASYRAYLTAHLINSISNRSYVATIVSTCSVYSSIIAFILSLIYGHFFSNFHLMNLYMAIFLAFIFGMALAILYIYRTEIIRLYPKIAYSSKQHYLKRYYSNFTYRQIYPSRIDINPALCDNSYLQCLYPAPMLLSYQNNMLEWQYIKGQNLSRLNKTEQIKILQQLKQIFKERIVRNILLAHGDLHPDNIIVTTNQQYYVVDWDLCAYKPIDFDILSLFTHPELKLSLDERISFLMEILNLSQNEVLIDIKNFIKQKILQIAPIPHETIKILIKKYQKLEEQVDYAR